MKIPQKASLRCYVLAREWSTAVIAAAAGERSQKTRNQDAHFVAQYVVVRSDALCLEGL